MEEINIAIITVTIVTNLLFAFLMGVAVYKVQVDFWESNFGEKVDAGNYLSKHCGAVTGCGMLGLLLVCFEWLMGISEIKIPTVTPQAGSLLYVFLWVLVGMLIIQGAVSLISGVPFDTPVKKIRRTHGLASLFGCGVLILLVFNALNVSGVIDVGTAKTIATTIISVL